ncbi:unnamed protein product [Adineta ricciae]|uniref:Uncharacterized protein n=1 Tax=Adineta ricciae TaxID=249248 RepID=A0A813MGM2_ADIRI|nr:unnamed protein product [Adineta ricciae]
MHWFRPHFLVSCSVLFLVFGGLDSASIMIGPNGIQLSGQNGNDQFINIALPINGFKVQISSDGGAVSSSVVNVPVIETANYRVDASSAGIGTQQAASAGTVRWYPQMYSNLGFTANTSINRQADPSVNTQLETHRSSQTHSSPNVQVQSPNRFTVNEAIPHVFVSSPAPQVQSKPSNSNGCETQVGSNGEKTISMANGNVNIVGQSLSCN